ncbi:MULTISPECIES: VOC family protein [Nocardia]|uniref:VOC family protein n=1 Tax=Nocardia TaxID=1817 RepID=UPI0007EBA415|nr:MULTISPECIES: VOC family protein [Nocardia]OBA51259.1 glyoxalase [Nocardia sp. 852002-51101_SCH5132738]OBB48391.1 glyoxalase [Nocardia sp. 852002-51244_SCH5132740]OBF85256.1 glyoxalase [Mycobacterium sp. 852002-51759_SCH5129042]
MATNVTSYVMRVSDLDRSIRFYREVFECSQALREPDAALLLTPSGFQLYLCVSRHHGALPVGGIGVEQIVWSADSGAELHRIEGRLREHYKSTYTHTRNGITFVDGVDPDGIRMLITHPTPQQLPREVIDDRFR